MISCYSFSSRMSATHMENSIILGCLGKIKPDFSKDKLQFELASFMKSEKAMAPHSSTLAWKIPWMEETGRLQSMGSLRVGHD